MDPLAREMPKLSRVSPPSDHKLLKHFFCAGFIFACHQHLTQGL